MLITLGIIGVVAALTLPSLINRTNKKELETAFKKQYSVLQQAILMIKNEDDLLFEPGNYGGNFLTRLASQYNSVVDCGSINGNTGCVVKNEDGVFDYYTSYSGGRIFSAYFDDGGFLSVDGTTFFVEQGEQASRTGYIVSIDVNGYKKRPNKMGYDLFMFQITKDGKVLPMGAEGTYWSSSREAHCNPQSTSNENGFTCAYYAATDKDYFKNLN